MRRGKGDRMLDGEDEMGAGNERTMHRCHQPPEVLDIVEGEGAVDQIEGLLRQRELFEVGQPVLDGWIRSVRLRAGEHLLGKIQPEDGGSALLPRPARKPPQAATQVDAPPAEIGRPSSRERVCAYV